MAGANAPGGGDSSGVSQGIEDQFLGWMEDRGHSGILAVGMPGTGKTFAGKAIGPTLGIPTITLDIGGLKSSLVGSTEQHVREALKRIDSVAGDGGVFCFATCNRESSLKPEFKRRFRAGRWFFDMPSKEEKGCIWDMKLMEYCPHGIVTNSADLADLKLPNDQMWTGAEIRNCVEMASKLKCSLVDAAEYVIPVAKAHPKMMDSLRQQARGCWLSASTKGAYQDPEPSTASNVRAIEVS